MATIQNSAVTPATVNVNISQSATGENKIYMANAYIAAKALARAVPYLVFEKFGQGYPLPSKSTRSIKFRRFEALDNTPTELTEGVTPQGQTMTFTDIDAELKQYGNLLVLSDVILGTADSPVMEQASALIGEQAAQVVERIRINTLLGGSNVEYANGTARAEVNTPISLGLQRRVTRKLKNQMARFITDTIASTPRFYTESVLPCFVAITHPDVEGDIRQLVGFKDAVDYGTTAPWENEIGACENVRYMFTTMMPVFQDAGGNVTNAAGNTMLSTTGTKADVYPVLFLAKDAYGLVPLKGMDALTPMIQNPTPTPSDPLAQRAYIAWKTMQTCVILNQAWMVRAEVAATAY